MEQQRALNALEPFLALSKSATSPRAATDLVTQATSAPGVYVFAELLQTPNIQALRQSPEHARYLKVLEIFAWGTIADYTAEADLPELNAQQIQKLQLLTLLPLLTLPAEKSGTDTLSYAYLQRALGLDSPAALEALVQNALYASLVEGHLDPLHQRVEITAVAPLRDLRPNSIPAHIRVFEQWESRCNVVLSEIEGSIRQIRERAWKKAEIDRRHDATFEEKLEKGGGKGKNGDPMELDDTRGVPGSGGIGSRKRNLRTMFSR